ncbi:aldo/keto reductase [Pseudonocardia sp. GCM10023141]|uniref:aldo/keto reductase n=1 Tax=Pseudonocardia sp. GCM10023141 TaxID=3252653 RepID=UPI00360860FF
MTEQTPPVRRVALGDTGIAIAPIGLGCMGMSQSYGAADRDESIATIRAAIDLGAGMLDTSDIYGAAGASWGNKEPVRGFGHNESLIGEAISGRRDDIVLATKFAALLTPDGGMTVSGRPEYVAQACDASLRRLGTDRIDLYYYHRLDPDVPIEETVGAMGELVRSGKVRALGLSEVSADNLRRAAAVHPIAALQSEYSLWERGVEARIVPACLELGVTLVPYSPLGRAMLAGRFATGETFGADDYRTTIPKFSGENFDANLKLVGQLKSFAEDRGATSGQIALAWLLAQEVPTAPIPGTKRVSYLKENLAALHVVLSRHDVDELAALFDPAAVQGARYGR